MGSGIVWVVDECVATLIIDMELSLVLIVVWHMDIMARFYHTAFHVCLRKTAQYSEAYLK